LSQSIRHEETKRTQLLLSIASIFDIVLDVLHARGGGVVPGRLGRRRRAYFLGVKVVETLLRVLLGLLRNVGVVDGSLETSGDTVGVLIYR